jgi:hypothetical protein
MAFHLSASKLADREISTEGKRKQEYEIKM